MSEEMTFTVEPCHETGGYVARWDDPLGRGGITTQGDSLNELQEMVADAVQGFFEADERPRQVRLHFVKDPVLQMARRFRGMSTVLRRSGLCDGLDSKASGRLVQITS